MVMELLQGGNLMDRVKHHVTPERFKDDRVCDKIWSALDTPTSKASFTEISPNILFVNGDPKVADFGIARWVFDVSLLRA